MPNRAEVIELYLDLLRGEIGVRESDDNSGPRVRQYQAATTLGGTHWPWCVALPSWAMRQTAEKLGVEIPWSYSASCDVIWADAKARNLIRATPQVGDVGLVKARKGKGFSSADAIHGFSVEKLFSQGVGTIEGNTNADGGREGVGVMRHVRPVSERFVWVRWIDAVRLPDETPVPAWHINVVRQGVSTRSIKAVMDAGTNYVATEDFALAAGLPLQWNAVDNEVILAGRAVEEQPRLSGGKSFFPLRVLALHVGATLSVSAQKRAVAVVF